MKEVVYRLIDKKDNESLAKLIRSVFDEFDVERVGTVYSDESTNHLSDLFEIDKAEYWVAEKSGSLVGGCGLYPTEGLDKDCAELVKLYLSSSVRGQGVGLHLLKSVIERATVLGYKQLYLESFSNFGKAVSMYEKLGFEHIDHPLGNSGHSACTIWMIKQLD